VRKLPSSGLQQMFVTRIRIFIGVNGTSINLEGSVWRQVVVGRPSHVTCWPSRAAFTGFFHQLRLLFLVMMRGNQGSGRTTSNPSQPAPRPTRPRVWPTWSTCQIHPCGDNYFDSWSTSLCHPLKCSNLVPKFLKSNKH
jgi:hypothetical protein